MPDVFSMPPAPAKSLIVLFSVIALVILPLLLLGYVAYSGGATRYEVSERGLTVKGTIYGRTLGWHELLADQARIVDLAAERSLQPTLRTNGIGLPGYQAGWFRLRGGKGLLFVTDRSSVVAIPTRKNYTLLMSVDRAEEFVATVQRSGG